LEEISSNAMIVSQDDLLLWHQRYAHVNLQRLQQMARDGSVVGLGDLKVEGRRHSVRCTVDCEACLDGKHAKKSFPARSTPRASHIAKRVYVDLCGPIGNTPTPAGNRYLALFKDECSAYRYAYFIPSKDGPYDCIRKCFAQIRSDMG